MSEPLITALVDSKPLTKNITGIERARQKWVSSDQPSTDKLMREAVAMPNMKEILAIMRKDILNLEKQIPWNCLVKSWKMHRIHWRKGVKESCTVQVREASTIVPLLENQDLGSSFSMFLAVSI